MGVLIMRPPAREQLEIVWRGEQVPGVTFYGLFPRSAGATSLFPEALWPAGVEVGSSILHNERWEVVVWDVAVAAWPSGEAWTRSVRGTLEALVDGGARVAWIGLEGFFCDPPDLFEPALMSEGVLAAMTADRDFRCPVDPDRPLASLTDEDLPRLRGASDGLSNVS
jgi:hypothetical protein